MSTRAVVLFVGSTLFSMVGTLTAAPTIWFEETPSSSVVSGDPYYVRVVGEDDEGDLDRVNLYKEWTPFAFSDGGTDVTPQEIGFRSRAGNWTYDIGAKVVTFRAQSFDVWGVPSAWDTHDVVITLATMIPPMPSVPSPLHPMVDGSGSRVPYAPFIIADQSNGTGAKVFAVAGQTNWRTEPWIPPQSGTYYFYVAQIADANHQGNNQDPVVGSICVNGNPFNLTVYKITQSPVGLSPASQTVVYGTSPGFSVTGTSGSGARIWGGAVSGPPPWTLPVGTHNITVNQEGDSNYLASGTAQMTVTVTKATQSSVSFTPGSQTISHGTTISFTASGGSSGNYFWSQNNTPIGQGTNASITFNNTSESSQTHTIKMYRGGDPNFYDSNEVSATITVNPVYYALSVTGGTGTGSYVEGTVINNITAIPPPGYAFSSWTKTGPGTLGPNANPTSFTMGAGNAGLTANFSAVNYTLSVQNGTGGGNYANGASVAISANAPPSGQLFSHWSITSGLGSVTNPTATSTNFLMGASHAGIQAVYYTPATPIVIGLHAAGYGTNSGQTLGIDSWQVGSTHQQTSASGAGSGTWTPVHQYRTIVPGLDYVVKVTGGSYERELRFEVPKGFTLYINDSPYANTSTVSMGNLNGSVGDSVEKHFFVVPADGSSALRPGFSIDPQLSSDDVIWAISLGRAGNGRNVGALALRKTNVTGQAFSLDVLTITNPEIPGVLDIYNDADFGGPWGYARRFVYSPGNCWLWLDDRVPGQPTSYCEIKAYDHLADPVWDSVTQRYKFKIGTTEINPFAKYVISSNAPTNDTVTITKNSGNSQQVSWTLRRTVTGNNTEWLLKNGTLQALRTVSIVSGTTTTDTITIEDGTGNVAQRFGKIYETFAWGKELVSEANDPTGLNLLTTYTYGTSGPGYGKLLSVTNPDGSFAKYEYAADDASYGKLWRTYTRWRDVVSSAASATPANAQTVTTTYAPVYGYLRDAIDTVTTTVPVSGTPTTIQKVEVTPNFTSVTFNGRKVRKESIKSFFGPGSSDYLASFRLAYHPDETAGDLANKLISETGPTGAKRSVIFYKGHFTDNGDANTSVFNVNSNSAVNTQWGEYRFHGFSTQVTGSQLVSTYDGQPIDPIYMVPNRSFVELTVLEMGRPIKSVRYIYTGASGGVPTFEFIGGNTETYAFDLATGIAVESRSDNRNALSQRIFTNGRLTREVANDGMETTYQYNALGWLIRKDLAGMAASGNYAAQGAVYTHFTYDAAGRKLTEKVSDSNSSTSPGPQITYHYDSAGRLDSEVNPSGLQTSYAYNLSLFRTTATFPGGATRIVETYPDGALKSISGTSVTPEYHTTSVATDGKITQKVYALRASDVSNPTSAPRWAGATTDWLSRRTRLEGPSPATGTSATVYAYNGKGQLTNVQTVDGSTGAPLVGDTVIEYDAYEVPYRSGVDLDGTAGLNPSSQSDRITETETLAEKDANSVWWLKTTTALYNQPGSATALTTSTLKQRLNKFSTAGTNVQSDTISLDVRDNQTRETVTVDRANRLVTTTTDWPDSSVDAVNIVRNGLLVREQSSSNLVTTHAYDTLRRLVCSTDPRIDGSTLAQNLAPRLGYHAGSSAVGSRYQVAWTRDTAGNQRSFAYSTGTGRVVSVQQPAVGSQSGKFTYYDYTVRGELYRQWGDVPHPVETVFNDYGEALLLKTFRGGTATTWTQSSWPSTPPTADLTKWVYDPATGVLLQKYDAANLDSAGQPISNAKAVSYTYNTLGQLKTRTWARNVSTTYKYYGEDSGDLKTAELKNIDYSNTVSTSDISYSYNRAGQVLGISDLTGQRTLAYSGTTTFLQTETLGSFYNNRVFTPKYETTGTGTLGRSTGFTLGVTGTTDYDVGYGYDAYGRPNSVATGGVTFSYGYVANSDLIGSVNETASTWSQIRTWVANRNLLDKIDTQVGGVSRAAFKYGYDELGRRTSVIQTGSMFDRYVGQGLVTRWEYNDRSEVTSARTYHGQTATDLSYPMAGRGHTYDFDHAGNRKSSAVESRQTTYGVNNLNQIKSRTIPGEVDVSGLAPTSSTVQAAGQAVTRQGDYYHKAVAVSNATAAVNASISVTSTAPAGTIARKVFVAKGTLLTAEEWQYDADGNLTRDDQWQYSWDAENRLVAMETRPEIIGTVVQATDARRLEFTYDYGGRRARKLVFSGWNGSTFSATPILDRRFIYNGWNLVGEYDALASFALIRTFTWGLDLSGTSHGAGGVGGLLMSREASTDYVYAYDGNGNIASVMNRATGAVVAEYEYSGFGELLRATGTYAQINPFRFSTKYADDETGLVYYGLRFYSPTQGRFLGRDPLGERGGLNLYGFCGNNGVNHSDYLGAITLSGIWDFLSNLISQIFAPDDSGGSSYPGLYIGIDFGGLSDSELYDLYEQYNPNPEPFTPPKKVAPPYTPSAVPPSPIGPVPGTSTPVPAAPPTQVTDPGPRTNPDASTSTGPVSVTVTEASANTVVATVSNTTSGPTPVVNVAAPPPRAPITTPNPASPRHVDTIPTITAGPSNAGLLALGVIDGLRDMQAAIKGVLMSNPIDIGKGIAARILEDGPAFPIKDMLREKEANDRMGIYGTGRNIFGAAAHVASIVIPAGMAARAERIAAAETNVLRTQVLQQQMGAETRMMDPKSIRFSQDSIKAVFKDPQFGSIDDLADGLRSGRIKPSDIEPIRLVERDGQLVSIDNRRLEAFQRAGVNIPTRMATPSEIQEAIKQGKFSAGELGSPTIRVRGR